MALFKEKQSLHLALTSENKYWGQILKGIYEPTTYLVTYTLTKQVEA